MLYKELFEKRKLLLNLSNLDMKKRYAGTFLGVVWAYINPMIRILVYWFVFAIGIKGGDNGLEYGMWLICGFVPWLYFNDAIRQAGKSYRNNASIIKNTSFNPPLLPASRMISLFYIHIGMVIILLGLLTINGNPIWNINLLYIIFLDFCMFCLTQAIVFFIAPLIGLNKDFSELTDTIMILLFWLTPILWEITNIPESIQFLFYLNPMFFVINGYRELLYAGSFNPFTLYTLYLFGFVVVFSLLGVFMNKKLKTVIVDKL